MTQLKFKHSLSFANADRPNGENFNKDFKKMWNSSSNYLSGIIAAFIGGVDSPWFIDPVDFETSNKAVQGFDFSIIIEEETNFETTFSASIVDFTGKIHVLVNSSSVERRRQNYIRHLTMANTSDQVKETPVLKEPEQTGLDLEKSDKQEICDEITTIFYLISSDRETISKLTEIPLYLIDKVIAGQIDTMSIVQLNELKHRATVARNKMALGHSIQTTAVEFKTAQEKKVAKEEPSKTSSGHQRTIESYMASLGLKSCDDIHNTVSIPVKYCQMIAQGDFDDIPVSYLDAAISGFERLSKQESAALTKAEKLTQDKAALSQEFRTLVTPLMQQHSVQSKAAAKLGVSAQYFSAMYSGRMSNLSIRKSTEVLQATKASLAELREKEAQALLEKTMSEEPAEEPEVSEEQMKKEVLGEIISLTAEMQMSDVDIQIFLKIGSYSYDCVFKNSAKDISLNTLKKYRGALQQEFEDRKSKPAASVKSLGELHRLVEKEPVKREEVSVALKFDKSFEKKATELLISKYGRGYETKAPRINHELFEGNRKGLLAISKNNIEIHRATGISLADINKSMNPGSKVHPRVMVAISLYLTELSKHDKA